MRARLFFPAIALLALTASASAETEKLAGRQWGGLTEQRRLYYAFGEREKLQDRGVVFTHPAGEYPALVDATLAKRPELLDRDLEEAFLETVLEKEPGAREALR